MADTGRGNWMNMDGSCSMGCDTRGLFHFFVHGLMRILTFWISDLYGRTILACFGSWSSCYGLADQIIQLTSYIFLLLILCVLIQMVARISFEGGDIIRSRGTTPLNIANLGNYWATGQFFMIIFERSFKNFGHFQAKNLLSSRSTSSCLFTPSSTFKHRRALPS